MTDEEEPKWKEDLKDFSDSKIERIEESVKEYLDSEGKGWSRDMAKNQDIYTAGYSEASLIQALKLIRRKFEHQGIIEVEEEEGTNPNATRKMWIPKNTGEKQDE